MSRFWKIFFVLSMLFMTTALFYSSHFATYVVQISVEPRSSPGIEMRRDKVIVFSNGEEAIFFDIAGDLYDSVISKVSLSLRDPKRGEFEKQENLNVSGGHFLRTVQFGSADNPITSDQNYPYIIDSGDDNSRLSEGNIQLQVKGIISGISQLWMNIIAGIGLLASVLQVIMFLRTEGKSRNRNPALLVEPAAMDGLNSTGEERKHET